MRVSKLLLLSALIPLASCAEGDAKPVSGSAMRSFGSEGEIEKFAKKMSALERRNRRSESEGAIMAAPPAMSVDAAVPAAEEAKSDQITNVQEAGVDEGGIAKAYGDYLVVLRRGKIFTLRHGGGRLETVDSIDAFPPNDRNPGDTWYDELLVSDGQAVIIGYSYGDAGTEISRFAISTEGKLSYRDTNYLESGDYYSSSNYASRLIGDELVFYAPVYLSWSQWRESLPTLKRRARSGIISQGEELVKPADLYIPEPYWDHPAQGLSMLHTVTRCDLKAARLDCSSSAVVGSWSRVFYVAPDAAYVWVGGIHDERGKASSDMLYRLPLDGKAPGAVAVSGSPVDQFSFRQDPGKDRLHVVVRQYGAGEGMWASERSSGGRTALLTVPLGEFGDGEYAAPKSAYRELPQLGGWSFQNRFVGRHLLYSAGSYGTNDEQSLVAVFLDGDEIERVPLKHTVSRLDVMGGDAVAVGPAQGQGLGFSAVTLNPRSGAARLENTYVLPNGGEGENRSQAFFYRPDPGVANGASGTLGLPVTLAAEPTWRKFLGSGAAMLFLRREDRRFAPLGQLQAHSEGAVEDDCKASCVDWYGNARPIFLGNRVFALMGYELVEGQIAGGNIREIRRLDFGPGGGRMAVAD